MADAKSEAIDRFSAAFCGANRLNRHSVIVAVRSSLMSLRLVDDSGAGEIDSIVNALVALHVAQEAEDAQCKR